ncbi:hypothetical protein N0V88_006352 [Collariella sp. IMI 366227]|nr:hypothetical protein N0V88_006352 [Collariella sp. IMI 366227]
MLAPRGNDCNDPTGRLCEKPAASSTKITWIIVGTVVGVLLIGTLSILAFFHFRRQKRDKREDREDRFQIRPAAPRGEEEIKWNPASAAAGAPGTDRGSPGYGRHARDPLQAGVEPKYTHGGGGRRGMKYVGDEL